jgi:cytochrome d ubiquinol oxidase subunit I
MLFSVIALTLVYAVLMVFEIRLLVRYVRGGIASAVPELAEPDQPADDDHPKSDVLAFAY